MPPALPPGRIVGVIAFIVVLAGLAGCGRSLKDPPGPPDLMRGAVADPHAHAFNLRAFHVQHIWAGAGNLADGADYRTKVAVWDYTHADPMVAELYFHDPDRFDPAGRHRNPDPDTAKSPFQIHFPIATLGPILQTLRSANERVYLYYYHGEWAVGIFVPEIVGSE